MCIASCEAQVTGETEVSRLHQATNQPPFPVVGKKEHASRTG